MTKREPEVQLSYLCKGEERRVRDLNEVCDWIAGLSGDPSGNPLSSLRDRTPSGFDATRSDRAQGGGQ